MPLPSLPATLLALTLCGTLDAAAPWQENNTLGTAALEAAYLPHDQEKLTTSGLSVFHSWKRVTLHANGLPATLSVHGQELLQRPCELLLIVNGQPVEWKPATPVVTESAQGRVTWLTRLESAVATAEITARVEHDFFIHYTLKLTPTGPLEIERLALLHHLAPAFTETAHWLKEGPNKAEAGAQASLRRFFGQIKDQKSFGLDFSPYLWLGNTKGGLGWNFESARNQHNAPEKAIEFTRDDQGATLTLNLISTPTRIDAPVHYPFSLQPTPIKKMPKNWRTWKIGAKVAPRLEVHERDANQLIYWSSLWRLSRESYNDAIANPPLLKKMAAIDKEHGLTLIPYIILNYASYGQYAPGEESNFYFQDPARKEMVERLSTEPKLFPQLKVPEGAEQLDSLEAWLERVNHAYQPNARGFLATVRASREWSDYLSWWLNRLLHEFDMDGFYLDGGGATIPDFRTDLGPELGGFTDAEGKLRPSYYLFESRDLLKRLHHLVKTKNPNGRIFAHTSGCKPLPQMAFYDACIPGETLFYWYHQPEVREKFGDGAYQYAHAIGDIDNLRAEFFWRQWGLPQILLPEVRGKDGKLMKDLEIGTRTMLAYMLHFDLLFWPNWSDTAQIYEWQKVRDAYGMEDSEEEYVEFTPYWENEEHIADAPEVKVSYYAKGYALDPYLPVPPKADRLLIISNLSFDARSVNVAIPKGWQQVEARNAYTSEPFKASEGKITLPLQPYEFAVLHLKAQTE